MFGPLNRLLAVRALLDVQFWFPTWLLFLLELGFSPLQAALADAAFHMVIVLAEIPMGRFVDWAGRKTALIISCALTTLVFCGIGFVDGFGMLLAVYTVWGLLWAMASGLDTTYAWELAESHPGTASPTQYLGRTRVVGGMAGGVSLLTAGGLMSIWAPLPFVTTAVLGVIALIVALTVPSIPRARASAHSLNGESLRAALSLPQVSIGVALAAILLTGGITPRILFQPIGLELGFGPVAISIGYTMIAIALALGGWLGARIIPHRRSRAAVAALAAMALSYVLAATTMSANLGWFTLLVSIPLGTAAFGLGKTVTDVWLVEAVGARRRATVLSLSSAASGLLMSIIRPLLIVFSGRASYEGAMLLWGGCTLLLCAVGAILTRRLKRAAEPGHRTPGNSR